MAIQSAGQITPLIEIESGGTLNVKAARTLRRVQVKTADYQVLETDSGTIFTNYGDGDAITFTLPTTPTDGLHFYFVSATDYNFTITAPDEKLITYRDATADGLTMTANEIGVAAFVFADGNMWYGISIGRGDFTVVSA